MGRQRDALQLPVICYSLKGSGYFSDSILPFTFTVNAALRPERMACLMISGEHLGELVRLFPKGEICPSRLEKRKVYARLLSKL
jgi:hypothetical protein